MKGREKILGVMVFLLLIGLISVEARAAGSAITCGYETRTGAAEVSVTITAPPYRELRIFKWQSNGWAYIHTIAGAYCIAVPGMGLYSVWDCPSGDTWEDTLIGCENPRTSANDYYDNDCAHRDQSGMPRRSLEGILIGGDRGGEA